MICDCERWHNCYFKQFKRKEEYLKQAENHIKDLDLMVHSGEERENELEIKLERAEQENKRLLEIINAKPLETVDIDSAFEIEKLKEQLQTKEQKIKSLKANIDEIVICDKKLKKMLDKKEQECETLKSENFTFEGLIKTQEEQLQPFNDDYFENLDTKTIAELAKKSIRLSTENRKLEDALDEIERFFDKRCDICREQNGIEVSCDFCWKKDVKDIINNANTAPTTIFDKIQSFSFDDCYIAILPFSKRIETLEEIKAWFNEEFKEQ